MHAGRIYARLVFGTTFYGFGNLVMRPAARVVDKKEAKHGLQTADALGCSIQVEINFKLPVGLALIV